MIMALARERGERYSWKNSIEGLLIQILLHLFTLHTLGYLTPIQMGLASPSTHEVIHFCCPQKPNLVLRLS